MVVVARTKGVDNQAVSLQPVTILLSPQRMEGNVKELAP